MLEGIGACERWTADYDRLGGESEQERIECGDRVRQFDACVLKNTTKWLSRLSSDIRPVLRGRPVTVYGRHSRPEQDGIVASGVVARAPDTRHASVVRRRVLISAASKI